MIRLVVNAEGLGVNAHADDGIVAAHRTGIVTSASLLGNSARLDDVRARLAEAPALGVGLSLALVGGAPVAPAAEVPSLVGPDGRLRVQAAEFALAIGTARIAAAEVERELDAQITRATGAGLALDHLATRSHLGFLPGVGAIVERLARRHGIAGIRSSVEPPTIAWIADPKRGLETGVLAGLAWLTRRQLGPLRHGPKTWGYLEAGRLDEIRILEIIGRIGPGSHEIICHPIAGPDGTAPAARAGEPGSEIEALRSQKVRTAIAERGIVLCRWRDLF